MKDLDFSSIDSHKLVDLLRKTGNESDLLKQKLKTTSTINNQVKSELFRRGIYIDKAF